MDFCFATFAALVTLFAAAACAPTVLTLQDACASVRSSSLELNHVSKTASVEARNGSKNVANFSTSLVWMEASDMCDPGTLKLKSQPCIQKMLNALTRYDSEVERVSGFQSCSKFASQVKPALHKLHKDMSYCVKSIGGSQHNKESQNSEEETHPVKHWEEALLCHYTLDRLFSFSILTARVFAVGDPAHHTEGSAPKCM